MLFDLNTTSWLLTRFLRDSGTALTSTGSLSMALTKRASATAMAQITCTHLVKEVEAFEYPTGAAHTSLITSLNVFLLGLFTNSVPTAGLKILHMLRNHNTAQAYATNRLSVVVFKAPPRKLQRQHSWKTHSLGSEGNDTDLLSSHTSNNYFSKQYLGSVTA